MIGLLLAGFGVGGVLGSLAAPWFQRRLPMKAIVIGANWVWALALPGIGLVDNLVVLAALLGLMAFVGPLWNVTIDVYRLLITPDELQGRVGSAISLLAWGAIPLGSLLAGYLLDSFGSWTTTMVLSVGMVLVALAASVSSAIRRAPSAAAPSTTPRGRRRRVQSARPSAGARVAWKLASARPSAARPAARSPETLSST